MTWCYWLYWLVKGGYPAPLPCCPEDWTLLTAPIHHPDLHRETQSDTGWLHRSHKPNKLKIYLWQTTTKLMSHIHFLFYLKKMKSTLIRLNNWSIRRADFLFHCKAKQRKLYLFDADAISIKIMCRDLFTKGWWKFVIVCFHWKKKQVGFLVFFTIWEELNQKYLISEKLLEYLAHFLL